MCVNLIGGCACAGVAGLVGALVCGWLCVGGVCLCVVEVWSRVFLCMWVVGCCVWLVWGDAGDCAWSTDGACCCVISYVVVVCGSCCGVLPCINVSCGVWLCVVVCVFGVVCGGVFVCFVVFVLVFGGGLLCCVGVGVCRLCVFLFVLCCWVC